MVEPLTVVPTLDTVGVVGGYHGGLEPKRSLTGRPAIDWQNRNPSRPLDSGR